jgi:hypothetical protein
MNRNVSAKDLFLFSEAWLLLAKARLMLVFRPFNKILPIIRNELPNNKPVDTILLEQIKLSIARACVRSPWRTKCFEQALAARMMLKRRGIATATYFGVSKNPDDKIEAHAWLKCGEFVVTGWERMDKYSVVGVF